MANYVFSTNRNSGSSESFDKQSSDRYRTGSDIEKTILFGSDIRKNKVPAFPSRPGNSISFPGNQGKMFMMPDNLLSRHLLLVGGTGSGKTNVFNFIIDSLLDQMNSDDTMLIFDPKGDFLKDFYRPHHWIIGSDESIRKLSRSWNIFDEMKNEYGHFDGNSNLLAKEIGKQLFIGRESESQPFFTQAASDLTSKILIHLMRQAAKNNSESELHTRDFVHFVKTAEIDAYHRMIYDPDNPDFRSASMYIGKPGDKLTPQALGVLGNISGMVNDLFIGPFASKSSSGSFSMRELIRNGGAKVLFVEYDLSVGETLSPVYRLLFDLALKEALGGRRRHKGNVYLVIDEFKLLPNLMHIDDGLNFGRSLGVKVFAGIQSINQLYDVYGMEKARVLVSGFSSCFCFSNPDPETRKWVSERFGTVYENLSFHSQSVPVTTQRSGYVVEDWDILRLQVGEAFISLPGSEPFRFHFSEY